MAKGVHEVWNRLDASATRYSIINVWKKVVWGIGISLAPSCATEEHLEPFHLIGQWIAVVVPGLAVLSIDGHVFIGWAVVDDAHGL